MPASPNCKVYHPQFFSDCRDQLIELSGLPPVWLHDNRHEAESLALAVSVALKAMQASLGHSSTRMTTHTYQTALPEMHAAKASASLDLITTYRAEKKKGTEGGRTGLTRAPDRAPSSRLGTRRAVI